MRPLLPLPASRSIDQPSIGPHPLSAAIVSALPAEAVRLAAPAVAKGVEARLRDTVTPRSQSAPVSVAAAKANLVADPGHDTVLFCSAEYGAMMAQEQGLISSNEYIDRMADGEADHVHSVAAQNQDMAKKMAIVLGRAARLKGAAAAAKEKPAAQAAGRASTSEFAHPDPGRAAGASSKSVVRTDHNGLAVGLVYVPVDGIDVPVYLAQPAGKTDLPVVLVVSEIVGLHDHIADIARRFAKLGYLALAPDLFARHGDAKSYTSVAELVKGAGSKVADQQVLTDLDAVVAYASAHGGSADKVGITGFSWGGRITWLYCAHNPTVRAGVAWYGPLLGTESALNPKSAIELAPQLNVPVLGLYGGTDNAIPLTSIKTMQTALAQGGSKSTFVIFPNSGSAFHADHRLSYVEADAQAAWKQCLAWFKANGVS